MIFGIGSAVTLVQTNTDRNIITERAQSAEALLAHRSGSDYHSLAIVVYTSFRGQDKPQYFTSESGSRRYSRGRGSSGTINAVITVQVGSQDSGTISHLFVDFNSKVKKGQIVAQIDPALFRGAVLQATADLANAKANVASAKANLDKAKATEVQTKADYERTISLVKESVMSRQQLDLAKANRDSASASLTSAAA